MSTPVIDIQAAHRYFAPACFNRVWDLLEKPGRSPADNDEMLQAALASLWHWSQRDDCQPRNLAVGYWQASRVQSVLGNGLEARRFGARSAMHAQNEPPFYMAYAHEALARAGQVLGDHAAVERHLAEARRLLDEVSDPDERALLIADLRSFSEAQSR